MAMFHKAEKIIMERNVRKFCGDNILIKFFFGCRIDIPKKKFQKKKKKIK